MKFWRNWSWTRYFFYTMSLIIIFGLGTYFSVFHGDNPARTAVLGTEAELSTCNTSECNFASFLRTNGIMEIMQNLSKLYNWPLQILITLMPKGSVCSEMGCAMLAVLFPIMESILLGIILTLIHGKIFARGGSAFGGKNRKLDSLPKN